MKNFYEYIQGAIEPLAEDQENGTMGEDDAALIIFSDEEHVGAFASGTKKRLAFSLADAMIRDEDIRMLVHVACRIAGEATKKKETPRKFKLGALRKKPIN